MTDRIWHQAYPPNVAAHLEYPPVTLHDLLAMRAERYPDKPALIFGSRSISYGELIMHVATLAAGLQALGLQPGGRVALYMPNCPQMVIAYFAVWQAGAVAVPISPAYVAREFEQQVLDAGASIAICPDVLWERVADVACAAGLRHMVVSRADELNVPVSVDLAETEAAASGGVKLHRWHELMSIAQGRTPAAVAVAPDDVAALLYTGGTTGVPKGARLTHLNLVTNAVQIAAWLADLVEGEEVVLTALPLTHSYSLTICMNQAVWRGYAQVLIPNARQIDQLLAAIDAHHTTLFPGVPSLFQAINQHPGVRAGQYRLSSIKACISGAAPLPAEVQHEFQRITGGRLVEGYGLTEAAPITHCNPLEGGRIGTIGLPLPDTDCRIVDADTETRVLGPEQEGVLCVSGPQVMAGYWGMPEETASVLRRDEDGRLWLHTGDIAVMSRDGYFRLVDRKKDVIIAGGGFKVYPREIEDVLIEHPQVADAAVIGVPPGGSDQRAKAFVVLRAGAEVDEAGLRAFCAERLAHYKVPRYIELRTSLPRNPVGKMLRRQLVEEER
jgi:long-chain acyl-CoA synthetase